MISIIICSIRPDYLAQVSANIALTIGVPFEIKVSDNRGTGKGICQVYNELAATAQFSYLVFVHEDVVFNKQDWGRELIRHFEENPETGAIGIAGSNYKSSAYSGWYTGFAEQDAYNIMHITHGKENPLVHYRNEKKDLYEAVCLDGVFMASTKENWEAVRFNAEKLKGFHLYDLDFSIRTFLRGKKVWIWMELQLEHLTIGGDFGTAWVKEALLFHEYMKPHLPAGKISDGNKEIAIAKWWLDFLKAFNITWELKWKWVMQQKLYMHPSTFYNLLKFLLYTPLGMEKVHLLLKNRQKNVKT
jgi:hypothetical protein